MKHKARFYSAGILVFALAAGLIVALNGAARSAVLAVVACATTTPCTGGTNSSSGAGVQGQSTSGHGVIGNTLFNSTGPSNGFSAVFGQDLSRTGTYDMGVQGVSARGYGVRGKSTLNVGIRGDSASLYGVEGTSTSNAGVYGLSTNSIGVYGVSTNYLGIYGSGPTYGLYGSSSGYGAVGVGSIGAYGSGTTYGVYGISSTGRGVLASSGSGQGLYATSSSTRSVEGHSSSGTSLYITEASGNGGDVTGSYVGLVARSNTFPLLATDASGNDLFYVDGSGNLFYHGALSHFATGAGGSTVVTSYAESTSPSIEETGTAHLAFGQANVMLSPSIARRINASRGYQVFLTPGGDTRGLYVAAKYTGGFTVREMQGGRSNIAFDYHVYATTAAPAAAAQAIGSAPRALPLQAGPLPAVAAPRQPAAQRPPE